VEGLHVGTPLANVTFVTYSSLTAANCVKRLMELGFTVSTTGTGMTMLRKNERRVLVPHVGIGPEMLHAILRSAGITDAEFFRNVARSGVYAKTKPAEDLARRRHDDDAQAHRRLTRRES